jgi:DNA-binding NarL/FixJ family response regulator
MSPRPSAPHLLRLQSADGTQQGPPALDPVRVLLCEDHEVYRLGQRALLEGESDLVVVGEAEDVSSACSLSDQLGSHVVVVRQGMLESPGYEPLRELCRRGAVLVLAESESELELVRALRAGARGYLSRRLGAARLLDAVRAVARDEPALEPAVARHLVRYLTDGPSSLAGGGLARTPLEQLTDRQRAVALLVAEGLTNEEIAARLFVSQATVKSHLTAVMRRFDIHSRTLLAILVHREAVLPA